MNKKILLCGAIAASLFLVACAKKESPSTENTTPAETEQMVTPTTPAVSESVDFVDVSSVQVEAGAESIVVTDTTSAQSQVPTPAPSVSPAPPPKPQKPVESAPAPVAEAPVAEDRPTYVAPPSSGGSQSQDDAVAAALAAAQPAIEN